MRFFHKISEMCYYYLDSIKTSRIGVRIENFKLDETTMNIVVTYRIGRKKLLHKLDIDEFESSFMEKMPNFDRYRLAKFSILQSVLNEVSKRNFFSKELLIEFIREKLQHEQLF